VWRTVIGITRLLNEIRGEPILLAHHPLCGRFDDHLLTLRGRKVCRGCITVYPAALAAMILVLLLGPEFEPAFIGSLVLFAAQLVRFAWSGRWTSILFNVVLGASLALVLYSAIVCPPDLRLFVYPFIITVFVVFQYLKGRKMLSQCESCPERAAYPECARAPRGPENSK